MSQYRQSTPAKSLVLDLCTKPTGLSKEYLVAAGSLYNAFDLALHKDEYHL